MQSIGERIKKRRKELGLSVDSLAEILGKNRATIYRYESDDIENMPTTILEPLARALKTTPAYLMGWKENVNFSQNLNFLMIYHGYDIEKLSKETSIHQQKIKSLLSNEVDPTMNELKLLSNCFGVKSSELLTSHMNSIGKVYSDEYVNTSLNAYDEVEQNFGYGMRQIVESAVNLNVDGYKKVIDYIEDLSDKYFKE